ncbi:unnamed protein product [Gongylonema pulchrum]|uniref:Uncharacterized protein n=1 Tax=Gongylonema pulchrum TaxID=637853 RepID=A0A3P6U060_9BILA|nr:unnamed protein product [Gongylonema pulchrum]
MHMAKNIWHDATNTVSGKYQLEFNLMKMLKLLSKNCTVHCKHAVTDFPFP